MVSYGESDDTLMQRILEESLRDANVPRHNERASSVGMNDSMDEVLLAKALEDSLSFNKHVTNSAAKNETEEEAMIRQAMEESMKEAAMPRASKTERLVGTDSDTDDESLMEAIHRSMKEDQKELAREGKRERKKEKKRLRRNSRQLASGQRRPSLDGDDLKLPVTTYDREESASSSRAGTRSTISKTLAQRDADNRLKAVLGNSYASIAATGGPNDLKPPSFKNVIKDTVDPAVMEEARAVAEAVEREDMLSELSDETRLKAEIMFSDAMAKYNRMTSSDSSNRSRHMRMVSRPRLENIIERAKREVEAEQRARLDEVRRARQAEEREMQRIVEAAEEEEMLSQLTPELRMEAEITYSNMMSEFQRQGGRKPRLDYAIALAKDKHREKENEARRKLEAEKKRLDDIKAAEVQRQREEEERIKAEEQKKIEARNNETREARAARFAAMYEKKAKANKNS